MTDLPTVDRVQRQAQIEARLERDRASDVARGIVNGMIIGCFMWAGFYGFIRLMVGIFGGGR